jgi:hypothetical protein
VALQREGFRRRQEGFEEPRAASHIARLFGTCRGGVHPRPLCKAARSRAGDTAEGIAPWLRASAASAALGEAAREPGA